MPKVLTQQQVDLYHEQGFVSPVDVMSEDEAEVYSERLKAVERSYPAEISPKNRNNAHLSLAFLDEIAHHRVIVDAVEDLIGPNISLWGSVLFIKEAQSAGYVSWHQDATYMGIVPHDFVTPWLALTPSNHHMLATDTLPGLKDGVRVVNVARGPLIDTAALLEGLSSGKIHSAALDVMEVEPLESDSWLRSFERCIFGSHNASNTAEAVRATSERAIEILQGYLQQTAGGS